MVETRDSDHAAEMIKALRKRYDKLTFTGQAAVPADEADELVNYESDSEGSLVNGKEHNKRRRSSVKQHPSISFTKANGEA